MAGRVAIVTGAASGMGASTARLLAEHGASVVVADVNEQGGAEVADEIGESALFCRLDVTSDSDWQTVVQTTLERFGHLDCLVNNAGAVRYTPIDKMSQDEFLRHVHVNMLGPWLGMKAVFGPMRRAGGGSIVNIGSTNAVRGAAGSTAYAASKHGLIGLTKSGAVEGGPFGIRVNAVLPGGVDTPMSREAIKTWLGERAHYTAKEAWAVPLRRIGVPGDIASMVLFLASDDSSYCTGAEFLVDGGAMADHPFLPAQGWLEHLAKLEAEVQESAGRTGSR